MIFRIGLFLLITVCFFSLSGLQNLELMEKINFTTKEMTLMSMKEWEESSLDLPEVKAALEAYHETKGFTQTIDEFLQFPDKYFANRLAALEILLESIKKANDSHSSLEALEKSALNKKMYIQALPSMLLAPSTKPEVLSLLPVMKKLSVQGHYWAEILDPLHRAGTSIHRWRWEASSIPNYFIYLDTVEGDDLLEKFEPLDFQVKYFYSELERAKHRLHFRDGLVYTAEGELFDTSAYGAAHSGEGFAIFVIGQDHNFYVNHHIRANLHHSSEFAGGDVTCAGEISAENGVIRAMSNKSGHYLPPGENMIESLKILKENLGSLEGITVHLWVLMDLLWGTADYGAEEFLNSSGRCLSLNSSGISSLHTVILQDYFELAEQAFAHADLNEQTYGYSALHLAVLAKRPSWIKFLLDNHASALVLDGQGRTPLEIAASGGDLESIQLLYSATKGWEARCQAFFESAKSGNLAAFLFFLRQGFSLSQVDKAGNTLFHYAAGGQNSDILNYLLNSDAAHLVALENELGESALHFAAAYGSLDSFCLLLDSKLHLEQTDRNGNTILHFAASGGKEEIIAFLLERAPQNLYVAKNHVGAIPLHYAAFKLHPKWLMPFLDKTGDIEAQDYQGNTLLFYALKGNNYVGYCSLIEKNADFRAINKKGYGLAHLAAGIKGPSLQLALTYDDQLRNAAFDGNTPLHVAFISKNIHAIMKFLPFASLELILLPNAKGESLLDLARALDNKDILEIIYFMSSYDLSKASEA